VAETAIEWCDKVWNPIVGCSRVSPGCVNCYAERTAHRQLHDAHRGLTVIRQGRPGWTGEVRFVPARLDDPRGWRKPRRIFVNSLSDVFHERLEHAQRAAIFGAMLFAPQHTYMVLTKRPAIAAAFEKWLVDTSEAEGITIRTLLMIAYFSALGVEMRDEHHAEVHQRERRGDRVQWWIGVTAEDQERADERIPILLTLRVLPTIRFVSYEPALGAVDLGLSSATCSCCPRWSSRWVRLHRHVRADFFGPGTRNVERGVYRATSNPHGALSVNGLGIKPEEFEALPGLDWIIVGGESGPRARPFDLAWARSVVAQGRAAGVPVFVKQLGATPHVGGACAGWATTSSERGRHWRMDDPTDYPLAVYEIRHGKGGDPNEWPEDLRVREWPRGAS
jgi:protein gp37